MPGASLKLSILNPAGRIWTMVAGGGASVIYADTVGDLGLAQELGNYAEYSGAPNAAETYAYAKTLLDWCAVVLEGSAGTAAAGLVSQSPPVSERPMQWVALCGTLGTASCSACLVAAFNAQLDRVQRHGEP